MRFGDGSTKGTNSEKKIRRGYTAAGIAAGAGTAGAGAALRVSGSRAKRDASTRLAGQQLDNRSVAHRVQRAAVASEMNRSFVQRELGRKEIRQARNANRSLREVKAQRVRDPKPDAARRNAALGRQKIYRNKASAPLSHIKQFASRWHEADRTIRHGGAQLKAGEAKARKISGEVASAAGRMKRGNRIMAAGGAIGLATLASRHKVARDWARTPSTQRAPERSEEHRSRVVSEAKTSGERYRGPAAVSRPKKRSPLKRVRGSVGPLSEADEARVRASLQDHGWAASDEERKKQLARHMQGREGQFR